MRPTAWVLLGACILGSPSALAVGWGTTPVDIPLGADVSVHREPVSYFAPLGFRTLTPTVTWSYRGLLPPPFGTTQIHNFASSGARIFAALDDGVVFTDDRGAHWSRASWDGSQAPRAMAFDDASGFGAAVGTNGTVWTTTDRGQSWRTRRDVGDVLVDVAVLGHVVAWTSIRGLVQVSADGGTSVRTLSERARGPMPVMSTWQSQLWIRVDGARWWRVDREGAAERADRSPWDG
ncbi:MAG: hypothetical protein EPO40_05325 [Myxococcaceae bacterium]|nr:MAG: hypothetical protein EPO40_05325 [Myxococcaceae bacterium]